MTGGESEGHGRRMYVVLGATVVAIVALVVYLMWPRTPDHVLLVGDSVTYMSWNALNDEFGSDTDLEPVARPGFRSDQLLPLAVEAIDKREAAGHPLDRAIFLVGYNDVWGGGHDRAAVEQLVEVSARHECAVWMTLPVRPGGDPPKTGDFDPDEAEVWNERLSELVEEYDNVHLSTEWADAIDGTSDADIYLEPDGIHPNVEGQRLLARIMHDKIVSACRFP